MEAIADIRYASFPRRVQAAIADGLILSLTLYGGGLALASTDLPTAVKAGFLFLFPFVLEPVLVATTGATLGHRLFGLRVQDADESVNIGLARATLRFLLKAFLGLVSLFLVLFTNRHQAIHDAVTRSVVVLGPGTGPEGGLQDRRLDRSDDENYLYPSVLRRTVVVVAHNIATFVVVSLLFGTLLGPRCLDAGSCGPTETLLQDLLITGWALYLAVSIYLGAKGRLWGCRRKPVSRPQDC